MYEYFIADFKIMKGGDEGTQQGEENRVERVQNE